MVIGKVITRELVIQALRIVGVLAKLLEYSWGGNDIRWELEPLGSNQVLPVDVRQREDVLLLMDVLLSQLEADLA